MENGDKQLTLSLSFVLCRKIIVVNENKNKFSFVIQLRNGTVESEKKKKKQITIWSIDLERDFPIFFS